MISVARLPTPIQAKFTFSGTPTLRGFGFWAERLSSDKPEVAAVAVITESWRKKSRRDDLELNYIFN